MGFEDIGYSLVELAFGIDAPYLSGHDTLPVASLDRMAAAKTVAMESGVALQCPMGGYDWMLQPRPMLRYWGRPKAAPLLEIATKLVAGFPGRGASW